MSYLLPNFLQGLNTISPFYFSFKLTKNEALLDFLILLNKEVIYTGLKQDIYLDLNTLRYAINPNIKHKFDAYKLIHDQLSDSVKRSRLYGSNLS